ncbi:MAG: hypothetical protein M3405_02155 [Acidobacteriota bacterium]|jgi:hypothetical protein|nr:hypothetical protein [Acidobacteriota bacterium]
MAENETQETQENKEEVTEAVATQSPSTDQGIDDPPTASEELSQEIAEEKTEAKPEESGKTDSKKTAEAKAETKPETKPEESGEIVNEEEKEPEEEEEISYHAVEKEGDITAIWEMQGPKHIRTISPRSTEGQKILNLFTSEIHETDSPPLSAEASS